VPANASSDWADHFPVASINPDPDYLADQAVACRPEGKIAIVDFYWTSEHEKKFNPYDEAFLVDGVMIWEYLRRMGEAAGFQVDIFTDEEINTGNFTKLQDYTYVIANGHGGRPGPKSAKHVGMAVTTLETEEIYDPEAVTANGISYFEAWKRGQIYYSAKTKKILWTPLLFRDGYRPAVRQQWLTSQCWALLPFWVGYYEDGGTWKYDISIDGDVYNLGEGLLDAGVESVLGYIDPAVWNAIPVNLVNYFRRAFGAYSKNDVPPARFGLNYWPACMSVETFFRLPSPPESYAEHAPKRLYNCTFTMYSKPEPQKQFMRAACSAYRFPHSAMKDFVLSVGTPATAFTNCWDTWWSAGKWPSTLVDALCGQGDSGYYTQEAAEDAGCQVKIARKVTNAILETSP
jgi:hypothetical protein